MTTQNSELVSGRELASILGFAPSYIAKLKRLGVLKNCFEQQTGRRWPKINIDIALQEIEKSKDPAREYVRERWEAYRKSGGSEAAGPPGGDEVSDGNDNTATATGTASENKETGSEAGTEVSSPGAGVDGAGQNVLSFNEAKAKKENFAAAQAELDYLQKAGSLVDIGSVRKEAFNSGRILRDSMMSIADRQSQVLAAETDPQRIHEILSGEISRTLNEYIQSIDAAGSREREAGLS